MASLSNESVTESVLPQMEDDSEDLSEAIDLEAPMFVVQEEQELPEDKPEDRDLNHEMVGKNVSALYEDGWATGKIVYYNFSLDKYMVQYKEDTDLISPSEIDGVEVKLQ